jgi:hypothetical protein
MYPNTAAVFQTTDGNDDDGGSGGDEDRIFPTEICSFPCH